MIMIVPTIWTQSVMNKLYSRRDVGSWKELFSLPMTVVMIEFKLVALAAAVLVLLLAQAELYAYCIGL